MKAEVGTDFLPDLTLILRRDGTVLSWSGGTAVPGLRQCLVEGRGLGAEASALLLRLARQSIARRAPLEARLREADCECEVRCTPQGPDRVICTLRASLPKTTDGTPDETGLRRRPRLERRDFTRQLRDRLATAALQERPLAVAVIQIDGLGAVAETIGTRTADRVLHAILDRLVEADEAQRPGRELLGQLRENVLALVLEQGDRRLIEARVAEVCAAISQPQLVEGIEFRLACHAGVALLGLEGATPTQLLDLATAAAAEASRAGVCAPRFHSDTVRVRSLERFDLARELRDAVESKQVGFRLVPRHELATGTLSTMLAYLHWPHPLRGSVPPAEFLAIAESIGYGATLSRVVMNHLCAAFSPGMKGLPAAVRVSFGPLREHVLHENFIDDVLSTCATHGIPAERLELRIAERAFVHGDLHNLRPLQRAGIRLVVDEVARGTSSLASLARAPLWGLQIDRAWAIRDTGAASVTFGVCKAVAALANSLGLEAIAAGVDDRQRRDWLIECGYRYGSGDLYAPAVDLTPGIMRRA